MDFVLVTTCTNRKRHKSIPSITAKDIPAGSQEDVLCSWSEIIFESLSKSKNLFRADNLYCGRGFAEAVKISKKYSSSLFIISAGLGLVLPNENIPKYNLTVNGNGLNDIKTKIKEPFDFSGWWNDLNRILKKPNPLSKTIRKNPNSNIVISVSSAYAKLIASDIGSLPDRYLERIRIIGLFDANILPVRLRSYVMPYTRIFNGPSCPIPGIQSDFSQRTTSHFITNVLSKVPSGDVKEHSGIVRSILKKFLPIEKTPKRKRLSNTEIEYIIDINWNLAGGNCAKMLRLFRDEFRISCEQYRFAKLFRTVKRKKKNEN